MSEFNEEQKADFEKLEAMVKGLWFQQVPTEEDLRAQIAAIKEIRAVLTPSLSDHHFDLVLDSLMKILGTRMDLGVLVEDKGHTPWLKERNLSWVHWKAYRQLLGQQGRSPVILDTLNQTLDTTLDHMGNPNDQSTWERRGLIIGQVQSGKTATYIGLVDKAIDAGYRVIVLLTGSTETLRQQTQSRVDEGVVGRDSKAASRNERSLSKAPLTVGVGEFLESTSSLISLTTMTHDFGKKSQQSSSIVMGEKNVIIFVSKKNTAILKRINSWLSSQKVGEGKLTLPLLLIDDEADYASINTKKAEEEPTATNLAIRSLLSLFSRNTYVGFTATPFANIFINDEDDDDLFPKDFIYGLESPSNYVGPEQIFSESGDFSGAVVEITDAEEEFPLGHKSSLTVSRIPASIGMAIRTFFLSNSIRDCRGEGETDRSMLINVSRFINVQEQVYLLVKDLVAEYKNAIELHAVAFEFGEPNSVIQGFKEVFEEQFTDSGIEWSAVLAALPSACRDIRVEIANSRTERKLQQDGLSRETPPRQIVVGGDILSRGLTLNGLSVSYFFRRTAAADTLMQMGRWFGYRDGYADLCRVWMTEEMTGLYSHVAATLEELRLELVRMKNQQLTPRQYGLAVRNHPDSLLITARNKMRAAKPGEKQVSLRGRAIESSSLPSDRDALEGNRAAMKILLQELATSKGLPNVKGQRAIWNQVDKVVVADFLSSFKTDNSALGAIFQGDALQRFVRGAQADDLQSWDVVFMGGAGPELELEGLPAEFRSPSREIKHGASGVWQVSGTKLRVAGPGDVSVTLDENARNSVRNDYFAEAPNAKSVPDKKYIERIERPLILIYPLRASDPTSFMPGLGPIGDALMVAIVLAIPGKAETTTKEDSVTYSLNTVAQQLWFPEIVGDVDEFDDDEYEELDDDE